MKGRSSMPLAVIATFLITLLAIAAIFIFGGKEKTAEIVLPGDIPAIAYPDSPYGGDNSGLNLIEVNEKTVQSVVKTLERPESYSRHLDIETFWSGGTYAYSADVWVRTGAVRMTVTGRETKNILVTEDQIYIWYDTDEVFEGIRDKSETLFQSADAFDMLPTYEDVLLLPASDIKSAVYDDYNGEYCIVVEAVSGEYLTEYAISVSSGLLIHAEKTTGEETVYIMNSSDTVLSSPPEEMFVLPNSNR